MLRCLQDLRTRQRLGLPPPAPVAEAAAAAVAAASPFAALSQAAFPGGGASGPDASGVAAAVAAAQRGAQAKPSSNLLMCDSTLLRLLSTSLQGPWQRNEASDAAAALLRDTEVQAAVRAVEAAAGIQPGSQQHLLQQQLQQQQAQLQQQDEVAASLLTCDSGMLRMFSDSLRGFWAPQDAPDAAAAALLRDPSGHTAMAAAMAAAAAAQASASAKPAPAGAAAPGAAPTPFAAAAMQPLAAPPMLHTLQQAGAPLPGVGSARPLSMALPAAGPASNRQTSLDMFNNSLLALGLTGAGGGPPAALPSEFLRLCSLPLAADMPLNFD